jgi:glycosyltransferase A (GT-A) superfamily protein (DUF2064 family)
LALSGSLAGAARGVEISRALAGWTVVTQRGSTFSQRLAAAHLDAGPGPVLQIGTDTPHVSAELLLGVADSLRTRPAVLGPAVDGGWWVLGLADPRHASVLTTVPMSTAGTGAATRAALEAAALTVGTAPPLRDVDTAEDAAAVAVAAPASRFARSWVAAEDGSWCEGEAP